MMGGLCFMHRGHMCCGVMKDQLVVRVGRERHADALAEPHVRPMDFTGRPLRGFVFVAPAGIRTRRILDRWVSRGVAFRRLAAEKDGEVAQRPARVAAREDG